ncbi:MAG: ABC transporter permease [Bacteroidota bacterium]
MLINYFKIAWRGLRKNKSSSFINIGGLATGIAVSLLIGLWIYDEMSYNKNFESYPRIAQVMQNQNFNGDIHTEKAVPIPLADKLRIDFGSDFKYIVLSSWTNAHVFTYKDKNLSQTGNFMQPDAGEMLSLKMIAGARNGLQDPSSILISQSVAQALFADGDALGKTIQLDKTDLKVAGVYEDFPANSSFSNLAFIAPWALYAREADVKDAGTNWGANSFQLFTQKADKREMQQVSAKIKDVKAKNTGEEASSTKPIVFLQPMSRWHLYAEFKNGINTGGQVQYVWLFGITGIFVLLLACINFMNLSTARSEKRAKEVGIRKTVGSLRGQLIIQFFCESLFLTFIAFGCSLLLVQIALPWFNQVAGKNMVVPWSNPLFWLTAVAFCGVTGLIAGSYPALYLSSFQPVKILKGTFRAGHFAAIPRKVLVVLQFSVSVILAISTIVVFRQIQFAKNRNAGYNREGLMIIRPYTDEFHNHLAAVRTDLLQTGLITDVAEGSFISKGSRTSGGLQWTGKNPAIQDNFMTFCISTEYGKAVGWQLLEGRDFSKDLVTDSAAIILNEAAISYMGFKKPIGEVVDWDKKYTVIGVTKNIIMQSPYDPPMPTIYYINAEANYLNIKVRAGADPGKAVAAVETIYKKYSPSSPFAYKFAEEEYERKFADEERIRSISTVFTFLAIFISCLGLFGLASFVAEQRTKEIGIRKILGASVFSLWSLLSKEFTILVGISLFIAFPTGWYFMNQWLQNFQYRADLSVWIFVLAGTGTMLITLLTVSFQSIKAAMMNPVKSLKTE